MKGIALLCDQTSTDELGIRYTAKKLGIDIDLIPFHKTTFSFDTSGFNYQTLGKNYTDDLIKTGVVINRCQSKSRRLIASVILESINKQIVNPQNIEIMCYSKLRTLLALASKGIKIPRTTFTPLNTYEKTSKDETIENTEIISELLMRELGETFVLKPDAGSQGKGVNLIQGKIMLKENLHKLKQDIVNPSGVIGQEAIPKWFYDLRILVNKRKGGSSTCHDFALARGGFTDFRTNTYLGNMVFKVKLPQTVKKEAKKCADIIAGDNDAWVLGLDAMPNIPPELRENEEVLKEHFKELRGPFEKVLEVKKMPDKKRRFDSYTLKVTEAYENYMKKESYHYIETIVNNTLNQVSHDVYFHEGNACPDFWEQTRVVAGINLAEDIIMCAQSLIQ